ncbi:hypothetical protein SK128_018135, partial [Halocaridina rubra]
MLRSRLPILKYIFDGYTGLSSILGCLYFLFNFALVFQLTRALYLSAFIYAHKSYVAKP